MIQGTSHVQCSTHEQFVMRFAELDLFSLALTPNTSPESCCGSLTRNANYPRPTITERHDDVIAELDARFSAMARNYAAESQALKNWVNGGNKLPDVYR